MLSHKISQISFAILFLLYSSQVITVPTANSIEYDAVIVGGGLSGLGTAKALAAANKTFIVLEARERPGGRVHNVAPPDGSYNEVGAEFIGPTQDKVIALADDLGLTLYPTYNTGNNILYQGGQRTEYDSGGLTGSVPPVDVSLLQVEAVQTDLDNKASMINLQNPWNSTNAAALDQ